MKQRGKPLGIRNGLKIYTRLQSKTRLRATTAKQTQRNATWREITEQRINEEHGLCQWCGLPGKRHAEFDFLSGHHIIKRRFRIDTPENCYVAHYHSCHMFIEDHNIDVREFPTKGDYEQRNTWDKRQISEGDINGKSSA